ncbi:cytosolic sulfotransferase 17-like [Solanum dulcamara]|uniref:cytosolic sulfotransferase 17-like n=1 Tax=Solanum dulcamara TaxID=45834 RepID=UPI002484F298|nr:cytosolic sulfotransferase 17-like [Solanum dulcamara]
MCSAPKTGCTWLKVLCYAIATRDRFNMENNPLLTNLPHALIPSLEFDLAKNPNIDAQNIPLIATHLPFDALPKSVQSLDGTKMIYLCREPKDTFISLWHFMQRFRWLQQGESDRATELLISFEEEFELFCEGKTIWGPYWDHVLGYWKQSLDKPESLLFLKYEELTKDTLFYVRKLA